MDLRLYASMFFATDTTEELIQIMDYSHEVDLPGREIS
jgi:hypothetical protein